MASKILWIGAGIGAIVGGYLLINHLRHIYPNTGIPFEKIALTESVAYLYTNHNDYTLPTAPGCWSGGQVTAPPGGAKYEYDCGLWHATLTHPVIDPSLKPTWTITLFYNTDAIVWQGSYAWNEGLGYTLTEISFTTTLGNLPFSRA